MQDISSLQTRQISRLHRELTESHRLLKLLHRVSNSYFLLRKSSEEPIFHLAEIIRLETEVSEDRAMQKQLVIDLNKAVEQRVKLVQVSSSLQEVNKTLQGKLEIMQQENKSLETRVFDLKNNLEVVMKAKNDLEATISQLKKALEASNSQYEKERTQWAREQQLHRQQEQKLIQMVQQAEKAPKTVAPQVLEELEMVKRQLGEAVKVAVELEEVRKELEGKTNLVGALERKCLRYERELKMREDEGEL